VKNDPRARPITPARAGASQMGEARELIPRVLSALAAPT
jgi:hypothetical protein